MTTDIEKIGYVKMFMERLHLAQQTDTVHHHTIYGRYRKLLEHYEKTKK